MYREQVCTMGEIWPESYIALDNLAVNSQEIGLSLLDSIANMGIVILIIAFFLSAFARIAGGLQIVSLSIFNYKNLLKIEGQTNLYTNRNAVLIFLLVVLSFMLANYNFYNPFIETGYPIGINFLIILIFFAIYFIFRYAMFAMLDWVNKRRFFKYIARVYYTYATMSAVLLIVGFAIDMLCEGVTESFLETYLICALSLPTVIYFVRGNQIIISNGFSHFFWILYLCSLEILPLAVLGHVIVS